MPELFKISDGPWKNLFSGNFQDHEIAIYINPESVLLVVIYEKEAGRVVGAVIELYKVLASIGELEGFVATLPREVIVLTKHTKEETIKYFLLGSAPSYARYTQDDFSGEVDKLLKRLKTANKMIKDVSKAYDLTLQELQDASEKVQTAFFAEPLLVPVVSTAAHPLGAALSETAAAEVAGLAKGEVIMGITREGNRVVEPLSMMLHTLVTEGSEKERGHVLHILVEGALLSNVPAVVFDWHGSFTGLAEATKDRAGLAKYKVDAEPIGFPVRQFDAAKELVVDLNIINPIGLARQFGAGEDAAVQILKEVMDRKGLKGSDDLASKIIKVQPTESWNAYQIRKAVRIVRLAALRYPKMLEGSNDIAEIAKSWPKGVGRAGIIRLDALDQRIALMVLHSILLGLLDFYKTKGKAKLTKAVIVLPESGKVVHFGSSDVLCSEVAAALSELPQCGVGHMLGAEKPTDIARELLDMMDARINVVKGNDVGVAMRDRKSYRVLLRPGLSTCSE